MTEESENPDPLEDAVRRRRERRQLQQREGERSLTENLAMIGALGWTIITPTLLGVFGGRWLDRHFGSGVFWTLGLLVAGLGIGCWMAWERMHRE
jgi:ATP synthase protein I